MIAIFARSICTSMDFQAVKDRNQEALDHLQYCLTNTAPTSTGQPRQAPGCSDEVFKVVVGSYAYFTFAFIDEGESGETVWLRTQVRTGSSHNTANERNFADNRRSLNTDRDVERIGSHRFMLDLTARDYQTASNDAKHCVNETLPPLTYPPHEILTLCTVALLTRFPPLMQCFSLGLPPA